ncbi:hemoblobin-interacting domain-containing protein [Cohnella herbarum]|uniref:DUF1533 domain-containing protein n=1 Tax=Cohnella herbarum TaxID=2728023 RepID=A0A7Z2VKB2_9BACL|nr:hemoblobin-interacting domain-containing protein [Cohnella herbarum]QJD84586.1 DUF1533 domain-containing protein [Cohnella herbarum]
MRKIHQKATAIFLAMLMVLGGMTGLLTPGGSKAYATGLQTISDANITNVVTSADHKTVTLTTNMFMTPRSDVSVTDTVYVKRTEPGAFVSLTADSAANTVTVTPTSPDGDDQTVFVLTFDVPLIGLVNQIQIQGQNFDAHDNMQYVGNATTGPLDLKAPAYVGSTSRNGEWVELYFDENLVYNTDEDIETFLRSKMSISTDGTTFEVIPEHMYLSFRDNWIYLEGRYNMKVILGENTRIKIASGTFMDSMGNLNDEMNLDVTPPVIQSAVLSDADKKVTITFNESIFENTDWIDGDLQDYIYLKKNGTRTDWVVGDGNGDGINDDSDTVSIVDGKLVVTFAQALVGRNNQIVIDGYVLKDFDGNIATNETISPTIEVGAVTDITPPKLLNYYFSSDKTNLTFVFDEDVLSNTADFNSRIDKGGSTWSWGNGIAVEFLANTIILHFNEPATGYQYYISIYSNSIKDKAGNVLNDGIYTNWMYPNTPLVLNYGRISQNGRLLNLDFNLDLADNTIVDGISHLKEMIKVSTDQGVNFEPLAVEDVVTIRGNRLLVLFHNAKKSGTLQVIVEADAVRYSHLINGLRNSEIKTVIVDNTPLLKGYFFSNSASEFEFEDDASWRSKVRDVIVYVYEGDDEVERKLTSSEYTLTAGKLTINKGVFQKGFDYRVYIDADGYSRNEIRGEAFNSSELFYMTAPVISKQSGIVAKVNLLRDNDIDVDNGSTQTVVFELFNGTTPVSIVASELDVYTGTYTAQFNVIDAATNDKYSVKAFVLNKFSNDYTNVGLKMTTEVTQTEYDLMLNEQIHNNQ